MCAANIQYDTSDFTTDSDQLFETSPKVAEDETTEQVFSRADRKAYRQAIEQRTKASARNTQSKTRSLGKESSAKGKAVR